MFSKALKEVTNFTRPVIVSVRHANGVVQSGCAAFIILNPEGWILTAAHVFQEMFGAQQHSIERADYERKVELINSDVSLNINQRRKRIQRLTNNPEWITNNSYWWGQDGTVLKELVVDQQADIALARLDPFDTSGVFIYPTFKNTADDMPTGTSLCRLGYPFNAITATFDEATNCFQLGQNTQIPLFPLEGIFTREINVVDEQTSRQVKFLETSSPGLRGQSGGPIFDTSGQVWALQSRTMHLPLGFSPTITHAGKQVVEHQFLNVGWGTHIETIIQFLDAHNVSYQIAAGPAVATSR